MALTVEDGTGLAAAESFFSVAEADTYHADRGNTSWAAAATTALKEEALRRASSYLDDSYGWKGRPVNGRDQGLAWPRTGVADGEGYSVASNVVPDEVERATAEIALRELAEPGAMTPDYVPSDRVKSEKIGPLSFEYDLSRTDAESARPILLIVRDLIGGLLVTGTGSRLAGTATRV